MSLGVLRPIYSRLRWWIFRFGGVQREKEAGSVTTDENRSGKCGICCTLLFDRPDDIVGICHLVARREELIFRFFVFPAFFTGGRSSIRPNVRGEVENRGAIRRASNLGEGGGVGPHSGKRFLLARIIVFR